MLRFTSRRDPGREGKCYAKDNTEVIDKMVVNEILCCIHVKFSEVDNGSYIHCNCLGIKECDVCNLFSSSSE